MKKVTLLATSIAVALTGCGSDSSSGSGEPPAPGGVVITAIDGYLANAKVYIDTNGNLQLDASDDVAGFTGIDGKLTVVEDINDSAIFVKAIAGQTIDSTRGLVSSDFVLAACISRG